jgi:excinuclease ABC subunit A
MLRAMNQRSTIRLRGCREHNLRDLDLEFERGTLTVVVGPSGAGKRSLVFATLHAESQRRFLQSCSLSERTRLESLSAPDLDSAENLLLTQAIKADSLARGPRNTVGTETGLLAKLQQQFAQHALPRCPACDQLVRGWSVEEIERELAQVPAGQRMMLGFLFSETLPLAEAIDWLNQAGFSRGVINKTTISFDRPLQPELSESTSAGLLVIVDRIKAGGSEQARVRESLETCFRAGRGRSLVLIQSESDPSPAEIIDGTTWMRRDFFRDLTCPGCLRSFPSPTFDLFRFTTSLGACPACHGWGSIRDSASKTLSTCLACEGTRWGDIPRMFEWNGRRLPDYCRLSIRELSDLFSDSEKFAALDHETIALSRRLMQLNLGALALDLASKQLSGSECRRIALARADSSSCVGRMFLLDDPFEGISADEREPVLDSLSELIAKGGTVCAIGDHPELVARADRIIELGPGSGEQGGTIVYSGPAADWKSASAQDSPANNAPSAKPKPERPLEIQGWNWSWTSSTAISISHKRLNVLAGPGATRPVGFVREVLIPLFVSGDDPAAGRISERELIGNVVVLSSAQGKSSPRQLVVSAVKAFVGVRELLAATEEARKRNFSAGYFSLHKSDGGRCPQCQGVGRIDVELDFLPELPMTCPTCHGQRYRETVDSVRFRGLSVVEILDQSVDEAFRFFRGHPAIQKKLQRLRRVHLGYLKLGQPLDHLSGGERRRVELASVLGQTREAGTLLILEEPSIGLSQSEVTELANALHEYVLAGNTILAVDHHPRMMQAADEILELAKLETSSE